MGYPIKKFLKTPAKSGLKHGEYESKVVSLADAEGYTPGAAFRIVYELTRDGKKWPFSEVFLNDPENPRTCEFLDYLTENGISEDSIEDFVGCQEHVKLLREVKNGHSYLNIVERKILISEA